VKRLLALTILAVLALVAPAAASSTQEATFQDDNHLIYSSRAEVRKTLDTMRGLGVDRIRVTLLWRGVAPKPDARERPDFRAEDPGAYPGGSWDRYDFVLAEALGRGIAVNFNVTGPGPAWAHRAAPREDAARTYEPDPVEFGRFVTAAALRYSGTYAGLPRVDYWSIWNEPNHQGWLTPQWRSGRWERSPALYRELFDQAHAALALTGHGQDTILVGETAPAGNDSRGIKRYMRPLTFVRALYCVNREQRTLRGRRARALGCPSDGKGFRRAHPGLFSATGFAHHPYVLTLAPRVRPLDPGQVTIGSLSRMTSVLDRVFRRYGSKRRLPLYLTEFGYQTPPDPFGVTFAEQARYLNESEYIAFGNPRVRTLAQFLLYDDKEPVPLTFQSGLMSRSGERKPSFGAYRLPARVPGRVRRGRAFTVWAGLRTGGPGSVAVIERRSGKSWKALRTVTVGNPRGYFTARVKLGRTSMLRVRFGEMVSRKLRVRVSRR
jgi:hypothetical protein